MRWRAAAVAVAAVALAASVVGCSSSSHNAAKPATSSTSVSSSTRAANAALQAGLAAEQKGELAQAIKDYEAAAKANPLDMLAYYDLGVVYQQQKNLPAASTAYQKALLINPKYQPAMFNLAILDTPSQPATAVSLYNQLLAINSRDANVQFNLGLLLEQLGNSKDGKSDVAAAIKLNPALASRLPASQRPGTTATTTAP